MVVRVCLDAKVQTVIRDQKGVLDQKDVLVIRDQEEREVPADLEDLQESLATVI